MPDLIPTLTVEPVGVTDSIHVITGTTLPADGVGITDPGLTSGITHTETDAVGATDDVGGEGPPTSVPATATGSLTLTATATATDPNVDYEVTTTLLDEYRAVRVNVSGLTGADDAVVYRATPNGLPEQVRLAVLVSTDQSQVGVDYEAPMDVPLTYTANFGGTIYTAAPITIPSHGLDWYCALGQPSLSRVITVERFPALTRALAHSRVRPLTSRNPLIITHVRTGGEGTLTLLTMTYAEAQSLRSMIELSPLFQFKTPQDRGIPGGTMYLLAGDYSDERVIDSANEPTRRFVIDVVEVDRPPLVVTPPAENTWQDWDDEQLDNSTWAAWAGKTWLDILIEDLTLTGGS